MLFPILHNLYTILLVSFKLMHFVSYCRTFLQPDDSIKDLQSASQYFSDIVPVQVTKKLLEEKRFKKAKEKCLDSFLRESKLDANEVQKVIDNIGISRDAYNQIFQLVQKKFKEGKGKTNFLPRPSFIKEIRRKTNEQVFNLLGNPLHITGTYQGKEKEKRYDQFNNIFF